MNTYILKVKEKDLEYSTDMLRYDGAFEIKKDGDTYEIRTIRFTPERWESFGVSRKRIEVFELGVLKKQYDEYCEEAIGFAKGIRFAQRFLKDREHRYLVEDWAGWQLN